ncbi:hypothetical protein SF83666_b67760 (plasmid) [Sinorhizobium fredii CCBAU 83666]|nr:hypothetical protein SF83666_b67760 [Sinorhizobium fredii CCBAU 83666]
MTATMGIEFRGDPGGAEPVGVRLDDGATRAGATCSASLS